VRPKLAIALASSLAIILLLALGPTGFLVGLTTALLPVPLYVALALWLDRHEPEPRHLLVHAFAWGMLVASLISLVMNAAAVAYMQLSLGLDAGHVRNLGEVLASPVFEEITKGAALFFLFHRERDEFDNITDGVIYAAMIGLGFAATENVLYYGRALDQDRLGVVFVLRGLAAPFAHPLFTAMTGIGFGWARETTDRRRAALRILAGLAAAIALHALWNAAGHARLFYWAYALIMVPTFVGTIALMHRALARERDIVRTQLHRFLAAGDIDEAELDALCGSAGVRGWVARRSRDPVIRKQAYLLHHARRCAVELGFACWHHQRLPDAGGDRVVARHASLRTALTDWRTG
jgi:protease PrsW